jgi:hypothetical protein
MRVNAARRAEDHAARFDAAVACGMVRQFTRLDALGCKGRAVQEPVRLVTDLVECR